MVDLMRARVHPPEDATVIHQDDIQGDFAPDHRSRLGGGGYGTVYRCARHPDLAVKHFKRPPKKLWMQRMMSVFYGPSPFAPGEPWHFESTEEYERTAKILRRLAHIPGYVHLHPIVHYDGSHQLLYSPLCTNNLLTLNRSLFKTMTPTWRKLATDLCSAVTYMHACDVCHMDIKPDNIFWTGHLIREAQFFLSDFDLAVDNTFVWGARGTERYMFKAWLQRWEPGIYPDDGDKYSVCKTLTERLQGPQDSLLMRPMLNVMTILNEGAEDEPDYMFKVEDMHAKVSIEFAALLMQLGLPCLADIQAQRKTAVRRAKRIASAAGAQAEHVVHW